MLSAIVFLLLSAYLTRALFNEARRRRAIQHIQGPLPSSWLLGNLVELQIPQIYGDFESACRKAYGLVYRFKGGFGRDRLAISDPKALQYIYNSAAFVNTPAYGTLIVWLLSEGGVSGKMGREHRELRSALNVGFSPAAIRNYGVIFERVAQKLVDRLAACMDENKHGVVDIVPLLTKAALASISEAALGVPLEEVPPEVVETNRQIVEESATRRPAQLIVDEILNLELLPGWLLRAMPKLAIGEVFKRIRDQVRYTERLGWQAVDSYMERGLDDSNALETLYGALLSDNKQGLGNLTVENLVQQTSTLFIAGQETSAIALSWLFTELARKPALQDALRTEALELRAKQVPFEQYPLLNAAIKASYMALTKYLLFK
ncbi:Cytochrome P450 [Mycena indigotica]|uniref:Cytochrome P450 n=1 Tax=Mycena indigotica TaxID=2126181 RepID=A0A8H6S190_9AGAR|nr:Cytochrome P450 [Mycena indigotica]KAF7291440.1 Cytochrome P450 [Mycena indigotica]